MLAGTPAAFITRAPSRGLKHIVPSPSEALRIGATFSFRNSLSVMPYGVSHMWKQ